MNARTLRFPLFQTVRGKSLNLVEDIMSRDGNKEVKLHSCYDFSD